jgi:hypothetical protein
MRGAEPGLGTIAYIQKDGLWTRDLPSGTPRRLVEGANLQAPRFSPSGKWISYFGNETLQTISHAGGAPSKLCRASQAQWVPGRDDLLAQYEEGLKLFTASAGFRAPTREIPRGELPAIFSANGSEMVYGDTVPGSDTSLGMPDRTGRLCSLALSSETGSAKPLFSKHLSGAVPAAWIDDGQILFWEDPYFSGSLAEDGLALFQTSGAGSSPKSMDLTSLIYGDWLTLSPARDRLAIVTGGGRYSWAQKRIAVIDLKSGQISYATGEETAAVFPSWSPRGDRIAYSAAPGPPGSEQIGGGDEAKSLLAARRIWVGSRQLTHDSRYRDEKPMWSDDGRHTLFGRIDSADRLTLWLTAMDSASPVQVAGPLGAGGPDASFGNYGYIDWRALMDWRR